MAEILTEIAVFLELKGENPFKTRAYLNAARALETLTEPLATLIAEQRLGTIKGIGEATQKKIIELMTSGRLIYYEELKGSVPAGLIAMRKMAARTTVGERAFQPKNRPAAVSQQEQR